MSEEWIEIMTLVRGFSPNGKQYFATVEYNTATKKLRAHSDWKKRVLEENKSEYKNPGTILGVPAYHEVDGNNTMIVLLGETYSVKARY